MNQILTGVIPKNLLLPITAMSVLNNKVIIPASKEIAKSITVNTGILTKSEAE